MTGFLLMTLLTMASATGADGLQKKEPSEAGAADVDRLDAYLSRLEPFGYSGAILVAERGRVVLARGYGHALWTEKPITSETAFLLASLSKPFTAAAILSLEEAGELRLSDPIGRFFENVPADKRDLTVEQLLTHTAGFPDWPGESAAIGRDSFVRGLLAQPLEADAGAISVYSNSGYQLLAAIVEIASGEPFEKYMRHRIFDPAGMKQTGFVWEPERFTAAALALAEGGAEPGTPLTDSSRWTLRGAGGMVSTVGDLFRFEQALQSGRILDPETMERFLSPRVDISESFYFKYGYGWRHQLDQEEAPVVWHSGYSGDYSAQYVRYLGPDILIIALWNRAIDLEPLRDIVMKTTRTGPRGSLGDALFEAMPFDVPPPASPLTSKSSRRLAGIHHLAGGGDIEVRRRGARTDLVPLSLDAARALYPEVQEVVWDTMKELLERLRESLGLAVETSARATALVAAGPFDPYDLWGHATESILDRWTAYETAHGPIRRIQVVSAVPHAVDDPSHWSALVELHFSGARVRERYIRWGEDEAYLLPGVPEALSAPLAEADGGAIVSHDLLGRGGIELRRRRNGVFELSARSAPRDVETHP